MSTDSNEKAHSTFPRSSLRARNRTIMMAPADIDDFRPEQRKTKTPIKLDEIFDDSLLETQDVLAATTEGGLVGGREVSPEVGADSEQKPDAEVSQKKLSAIHEPIPTVENQETLSDKAASDPRSVAGLAPVDTHEPDGFHQVGGDLEDPPHSIAPVAKILRAAADGGASRESKPRDVTQASVLTPSQSTSEEDLELEHTMTPEEIMEELLQTEHEGEVDSEREHMEIHKLSKLVGFLVSYESDKFGRYVELREGRLLVSSEGRASDNCLVIDDLSVSPMHAIMRISANGTIMILDQLSEHGTRIKRCASGKEESLLGDKSSLEHGDVVIFGECAYHVCILKGI